jgi:hypothetical protein
VRHAHVTAQVEQHDQEVDALFNMSGISKVKISHCVAELLATTDLDFLEAEESVT